MESDSFEDCASLLVLCIQYSVFKIKLMLNLCMAMINNNVRVSPHEVKTYPEKTKIIFEPCHVQKLKL